MNEGNKNQFPAIFTSHGHAQIEFSSKFHLENVNVTTKPEQKHAHCATGQKEHNQYVFSEIA